MKFVEAIANVFRIPDLRKRENRLNLAILVKF